MARTYEETIYDAAVEAVNDALAQPKLPTPDEIKGNILDNSRNAVEMYNSIAQPRAKWKVPTELVPFQVAYVMLRLHYVALINMSEVETNPDRMVLGVYVDEGDDEGIYTTNETTAKLVLSVLEELDGNDVKVVSFDGGKEQLERLEEGSLDGLIVQNPFGIGYATVVACARAILSQGNEAEVNAGFTWVTRDNMDSEAIQKMMY